jgi:hypothetical protein
LDGSIGNLNNDGYFRIHNSSLENNGCIRGAIITLFDSLDQ